jgi:hypothetical protein
LKASKTPNILDCFLTDFFLNRDLEKLDNRINTAYSDPARNRKYPSEKV